MNIIFVIVLLVALPRSGTLTSYFYGKDFETKLTPRFQHLAGNVSKILCSIDIKLISICTELKSKSDIVDDVLRKTLECVTGAPIIMIGLHPSRENHAIEANGSHLIIVALKNRKMNLSILHKMQTQHHRLYYIFIFDDEPPNEFRNFLRFIFRNYNVLNAIAVVQRARKTELRIRTYNPFTKRNIRIAPNVYRKNELFIEKDRNLFGYPLRITRYRNLSQKYKDVNGTRSLIINLNKFVPQVVADVMNATLKLSKPYIDEINWKQIADADLLVNGRLYSASRYEELKVEPTISIKRDDICALVPFKRFRPMVDSIYRTLHPSVWICAVVVACIVTIILLIIIKMDLQIDNRPTIVYLFGNKLKLKGEALVTRTILGQWILYCVTVTCIFQSGLYQGVTTEGRIAKIHNFVDLINSKFQIITNEAFYNAAHDILNNSSLAGHYSVIGVKEFLENVLSKNTDYAYIWLQKHSNHMENLLVDNDYNILPIYYTMKPCIHQQIVFYYVRRGSPFLNRINQILRQSQENGLFSYWEKQLHKPASVLKRPDLHHREDSGHLKNLYFIFEYWFYASLVCCFGFFVELTVHLFYESS